jgi:transglutaminase-like putative cysteine protease
MSLRLTAFVLGMAAVLLSAGLRFDGGDFIVLLAVLAGIKPLEIKHRRDSIGTIFLAYFLVITSLFVFENLAMILYLFISVWVTTSVLIHINHPNGIFRLQMRLAARLVFMALPLMVLLFLLFPRFSSSFLGAPWVKRSYTGFSNTIRIGDISQLVVVDSPAFSVAFNTLLPATEQLYWRGIVFQYFDGKTWRPARNQSIRKNRINGEKMSHYQIILEPHGQRHLFALDLPQKIHSMASIMQDHTVLARWPVRQRFSYNATSILNYRQNAADVSPERYLQLPLNRNPKTITLAKQWNRLYTIPEVIVNTALTYFNSNDFVYSLQPDRMGKDAVDDFIFTFRKGFCEHFATAFAVLMRAAGIPTRIVGGYQGGKWNAVGKFLTVRQSDAHVWCEVWLAEKGWVRVDPTFAVAPNRIDTGLEAALGEKNLPDFLIGDNNNLLIRLGQTVKQTLEAVNMRWNMWFMGFSMEDQLALLKQLGVSIGRKGVWLVFIILLPLSIAATILLNRIIGQKTAKQPSEDKALKIYNRFLNKLAKIGLPKMPHQGPLDYAQSVITLHPQLQSDISEITDCYIKLRYGNATGKNILKTLQFKVKGFKPQQTVKLAKGIINDRKQQV